MALKVSTDAQLLFFSKVFGPKHAVTEKVKALLGVGVTFEVSLFNVQASKNGVAFPSIQLTCGTTALIKGSVIPAVEALNKEVIEKWVTDLYVKQGTPVPKVPETGVVLVGWSSPSKKLPVIKAVMNLTGYNLKTAKEKVEAAEYGESVIATYPVLASAEVAAKILTDAGGYVNLVPKPVKAKPVYTAHTDAGMWSGQVPQPKAEVIAEVIHLKDAKALGQQVHGTSPGSIYYTIALTETVKVAARLYKSGAISLRAEWEGNPEAELKKLEAAGLQLKMGQSYGSIHFDAAQVPLERVIGAFLFGTGIQWKSVVTSGAGLVVSEKG